VKDTTGWSRRLTVTTGGKGVGSHAGAVALRLTADRTGLTRALSRALHRPDFTPGHDLGGHGSIMPFARGHCVVDGTPDGLGEFGPRGNESAASS
jgi:hypothetical protein